MPSSRPAAPLLLLSVLALAPACGSGGGGGGDDSGSLGLSAGANQSVLTSEPVSFTATAPESSGITSFSWRQTAGPALDLGNAGAAMLSFFAPDRPGTVELEVTGLAASGADLARDRVVITVSGVRPELRSELRSTINIRGGGAGRAMASAVHLGSERLFVIDGVAGDVVAYDVSNPASPNFLGAVERAEPTLGFFPGQPLAVAAGDTGAVAITWSGETPAFPGIVQLIDPVTLQSLAQVSTTGANPVDIDASADGLLFAVACAGDEVTVGSGDGLGYVTLVEIPSGGPGAIQVHSNLFPIVLNPFDGNEAELAQAGVRFFDANPRASVELTPRSIAVSPDGATVWASCPENDALIVIDAASKLITDLVPLEDRGFDPGSRSFEADAARYVFDDAPTAFVTSAAQPLPFGGVTGLVGRQLTAIPVLRVLTVSGAGAATGVADRNGNGTPDVTLVDADAPVALREITIPLGAPASQVTLSADPVPLTGSGGAPITGRPSRLDAAPGLAGRDEEALDLEGQPLASDALGARFGGASRGFGDMVWLADSRRNGIWSIAPNGSVAARFVPSGSPAALGTGVLPEVFSQRRLNLSLEPGQRYGGFGGVAYHFERNAVMAAVRLPLDNPDTSDDAASRASRIARMVEVSPSGAVLGEYVVVLEAAGHALEGMTTATDLAGANEEYLLLEASTDPSGLRAIFALDLAGATNLRDLSTADYAAVSAALETTSPDALQGLAVPVTPVAKRLRADLRALGLGGGVGQPSAIVSLEDFLVGVAFNDGFQLEDATFGVGAGGTTEVQNLSGSAAQMAVVYLLPNGADFSGDGVSSSSPIRGLHQPLDLAPLEVDGRTLLYTANGGFARVLEDPATGVPFDERARLGGLLLDTGVFPSASTLQDPAVSGDLLVSTVGADLNGDMLVDRLQAFGSRSVSLRDRVGGELWASGRSLISRAREIAPTQVTNGATLYGIRPRSLALGSLGGEDVMAAALEGASSVMLYDLSTPTAPVLAGVGSRAVRPVDVDFASIGGATLFVTDEAQGRIEIRRVTRP